MLLCLQTIPADNVIVEVFVESTSSGNSLHRSMYFWSSLSMSNRIATSRLSVSGTTYVGEWLCECLRTFTPNSRLKTIYSV
jgi:hypothetical protein